MFGLRIYESAQPVEVLTIGRPGAIEAPIYFMRRDGHPVMRWARFGPCAEHGEGGKARDKSHIRGGDKIWQVSPPT